jgi:hypothetical protein
VGKTEEDDREKEKRKDLKKARRTYDPRPTLITTAVLFIAANSASPIESRSFAE